MSKDLTGRVALVTGAAQGIGTATARALQAAGARVHAADMDGAGLSRALEGLAVTTHTADLADRARAHALVEAITAADDHVDILVNAAGGVRGQVGQPLETVTEDTWRALFEANADSAFWMAQAVAPGMRKRQSGRIVNIASGAGLRPSLTGIQGYTAAKHALVGITRQLSFELAHDGITVNAVAPGLILSNPTTRAQWDAYGAEGQARLLTAIHSRRLGSAEDIANAVMFFVSDAAAWITGQILSVDGGRS